MSGIKERPLADFMRFIGNRLGGAGVLAQFAGVGRCHLSSMLGGDNNRGRFTWAKVRRQVTAAEWSFLEQCSAWNSFRQVHPEISDEVLRTPTVDDRDNPLMQVACSCCGRALHVVRCVPSQGGTLSHGLCPACYTQRMTPIKSAAEIDATLAACAVQDAANPAIIPLGSPRMLEAELFAPALSA